MKNQNRATGKGGKKVSPSQSPKNPESAVVKTRTEPVTLAVLSGSAIEDEIEIPASWLESIKRRAACVFMSPGDYIRELMFKEQALLSDAITVALSIDGDPIGSFTLSVPMSVTLRQMARTENKELPELFAKAIDLLTRGKHQADSLDHLANYHIVPQANS
ncbi:MAG TPA: hypothetical protein VKV04_07480 [Verrucomicrobiae bacterium]|nr:hypothetical protein [Verrucomicrobiae bacterium]